MSCRATPYRGFKSHRHRRKVNPRLPCKQAEGGGSSFVQSRLVGTCSACRHICFARVPRGGAREARAPREVFHHRCGTPVSLGYTGMAVYLEVCGVPEGGGRGALGAGAGLECGATPRCDARESPRASGQRPRRITHQEAAHCCVGKFWVSLWQPSRRNRQATGLSNSRVRV